MRSGRVRNEKIAADDRALLHISGFTEKTVQHIWNQRPTDLSVMHSL